MRSSASTTLPSRRDLHFPLGQVDHAVGQVVAVRRPRVSECAQHREEALEVVLLLAADHVDRRVEVVLGDLEDGGPDVLADVEARAVGPQHRDLLGGPAFFQPELGLRQVVDRVAALVGRKDVFPEPLGNDVLAERVGVRLVVEDVEVRPEAPVGCREPVVDPLVHALPETEGFRIAGLPFFQHLLDVGFKRGVFFRFDRVARHCRIPTKSSPFIPGGLRGGAVFPKRCQASMLLQMCTPRSLIRMDLTTRCPVAASRRATAMPSVHCAGALSAGACWCWAREILHHHAPVLAGA